MKKEHLLFLLFGFVLGGIVGTLILGPILVARGIIPAPGSKASQIVAAPKPATPPQNAGPDVMQQVLAQIDTLKKRLEANPHDADAAIQLGNLYMDARKYDQAISYYEKGLAARPHPDVATDLGICYRAKGDSAKALEVFRSVLEIDPKHFQARFNEAVALVDLNRAAEARAIVDQLKRERPDDPEVQRFVNVLAQIKG